MYKDINQRASGKTTRLIEQADKLVKETVNGKVYIVCHNPQYIRERMKLMGYGINSNIYPISVVDYIYGDSDQGDGFILIDELDMFLQIFDGNIKGYTLSAEG